MKYLLLAGLLFVSTILFILALKFKPQLIPAPLRTKYSLPLLLFMVLSMFLGIGLKLKPHLLPSPLLNKPAPSFSVPQLAKPTEQLGPADLKGKVWLFNVWASWCPSCRQEHPVLNDLAKQKIVTMVGLVYKDEADTARNWLDNRGNPYDVVLLDTEGRLGIDWGVYGVPETFVIDKKGIVRYKHAAPITPEDVQDTFIPLIKKLQAESE